MNKRILTVALAALMLLSITFVASAAVQVTEVKVRGTVADAGADGSVMPSWDYQSFAGFFYDIKNNISTETLTIGADLDSLEANGTIPKNLLVYSTNPQPLQFKMNEKENVTVDSNANYTVVGWQAEKWVAVNGIGNKLAKLAFEMDKEDKKTLTTGETWSLGSGYELSINAVDARATPRQVWFSLKKDGAIIDEGIGQGASSDATSKQNAVYYKTKTILAEQDSLLFAVYVDSIFSGATSDMVQFKYAWLIDESSAKEISGSDTFGVFEVTRAGADGISMYNKNSVSISRNSEATLMGNLKFVVADNAVLRFYPQVTYTTPGKYEVRGSVADANVNGSVMPSWNAQNFAGFFYDIKNNISTETLTIGADLDSLEANGTIPKNLLVYSTNPQPLQFKMNEKENVTVDSNANYTVVGWQAEKWVAVNGIGNKLAKLAFEMDKEDKKTLTTGETWSLGSGYELSINAVDARATPRQVWFTLKKDGAIIDEGIGQGASSDAASKQNAVYYKTKTILAEQDSLLFAVYVDSIFSGATSDMVQFKYGWLIDESSAKEISGSDTFGVFEVTRAGADGISMYNKNSVSISRNSEATLMGDMKFKVADSAVLRFYPKVDLEIGGEGGDVVTGTTKGATPTVTVTGKATTTLTVAPTEEKPEVTAAPTTAETEAPTETPKEPGFEAVFAIAGLLAVAFLVLRQRK